MTEGISQQEKELISDAQKMQKAMAPMIAQLQEAAKAMAPQLKEIESFRNQILPTLKSIEHWQKSFIRAAGNTRGLSSSETRS
jgi:hypothetical protein